MQKKPIALFVSLLLCLAIVAGCKKKKATVQPAAVNNGAATPTERELLVAAGHGDTARVKQLLDGGARVNAQDPDGRSALMEAAFNGHVDTVKFLLDHGGDLSLKKTDGATVPQLADGHKDIQEIFAGVGELIEAAVKGDDTKITNLTNKGIPVNGRNEVGSTALAEASWNGHFDTAKLLLEKGADPSIRKTDGALPADLATSQKHPDIAQLLTGGALSSGQAPAATPAK